MKPIVIIGAPRSGTNVLRDVLTRFPGLTTWPCDEINAMWRHGNTRFPNDELPPALATPAVRRHMRGQFERLAARRGCELVVEKTCANSLRVEFVDRILPDARYLFIVRDGVDAVASAMKRWTAPLDLPYTLRKLRWVPPGDLPHYAARFARNRLHRMLAGDKRLALWGPVFDGMPEAAAALPLEEVCALQWQRCVEHATASLDRISPERVFRLRYEDLATDPTEAVAEILAFLGRPAGAEDVVTATDIVRADSIGKGRRQLTEQQLRRVEERLAGGSASE